jgi:hypothetical protein
MTDVTPTTTTTLSEWLKLLECPVCMNLLNNPVTTICGHTFCSSCLMQSVRVQPSCPLCRAVCPCNVTRPVNKLVDQVMNLVLPQTLLSQRGGASLASPNNHQQDALLPIRLPLFILGPSVFLIPGATLHLSVFEPRYRLLMRRCLEHGVRFGLQSGGSSGRGVLIRVDSATPTNNGDVHMVGFAEGRYVKATPDSVPAQEPNTFGLYALDAVVCEDAPPVNEVEEEQIRVLANSARVAVASRCLAPGSRQTQPPTSPVLLSFWLLSMLNIPRNEAEDVMFERSIKTRLEYAVQKLESGVNVMMV